MHSIRFKQIPYAGIMRIKFQVENGMYVPEIWREVWPLIKFCKISLFASASLSFTEIKKKNYFQIGLLADGIL